MSNAATGSPHILSPMHVYFDARVDISDTYWAGEDGVVSSTIVRPTDEFFERNDLARFGVFLLGGQKRAPRKRRQGPLGTLPPNLAIAQAALQIQSNIHV